MAKAEPQRGEVWLVDLGYEAKIRPCLILSIPFEDHERAIITCVECTTQQRGTRFEVEAALPFLRQPGVFDAQGLITRPQAKFQRKLGKLEASKLIEVENAVKRWLGFLPDQLSGDSEPRSRVIQLDPPDNP